MFLKANKALILRDCAAKMLREETDQEHFADAPMNSHQGSK